MSNDAKADKTNSETSAETQETTADSHNNSVNSTSTPTGRLRLRTSNSTYSPGLKLLLALALATVAGIGLYQIRSLIGPAFFALTLVLTVRPIQRALLKRHVPRWLASIITITVLILVLAGVVTLLTVSMSGLPDLIASYNHRVNTLVNDVFEVANKYDLSTERIEQEVTKNFSMSSVASALSSVLSSVSSTGSALIVIAMTVLFVTIDMGDIAARARVVENHDEGIFNALSAFEGRIRQYWLVSTIFGLIVAVIDGIVLYILDIPMAFAWAMLSFVTNYIPNIGFVIGLIPPALIGLIDGGPWTALWVIVAYSVINVVIQSFIQPKFTGDAVGLTPTTTFISLLFWAVVVGPIGTILAVPLTLFAKALLIDASPSTRWIEVFLVPDSEVAEKKKQGFYDEKAPAPDTFVDFTAAPRPKIKNSHHRLRELIHNRETARTAEEKAKE